MRVAFVGLGVMGFPMAGHLAAAGHEVRVYNRSEEKALRWAEQHTGIPCATPAEAAAGAQVVCVCVGNDDDVRAVTLGDDGILGALAAGACIIDHTTASAVLARELAELCHQQGVDFLDAPVSGGQAGAENGVLTVMVGGEEAVFARHLSLMQCYGRTVQRIGEHGAGQLSKMANQICIAGLVQGLAEAVHFAKAAGLDTEKVFDTIGGGAAQSWQMDNRASSMSEGRYDFGFAVDWMRKDLHIVLEEARKQGVSLPVTALVDQFYADVQGLGGGRWDTSSLLARLQALQPQQ